VELKEQKVNLEVGGGSMPVFVARPAGGEPLPAIIVIHEIYGLTPHHEGVARRFAEKGFVAAAPPLFFQTEIPDFSDRASFMRFRQNLKDEEMLRNVDAVVDYLQADRGVDGEHIGIVGYCFGGYTALIETAHNPAIKALADYYGGGSRETVLEAARQVHVPVLGMFGEKDQSIPADLVHETERAMQEAGADTEFHIYPNAGHAFFNDTGERYVESAARDAWPKTVEFFTRTLKGAAVAR
jgi:carboxymethylenebutenolidase